MEIALDMGAFAHWKQQLEFYRILSAFQPGGSASQLQFKIKIFEPSTCRYVPWCLCMQVDSSDNVYQSMQLLFLEEAPRTYQAWRHLATTNISEEWFLKERFR
jgi:hypothetical protein